MWPALNNFVAREIHPNFTKSIYCSQMDLIDLKYNNELKNIFETSESNIDIYKYNAYHKKKKQIS